MKDIDYVLLKNTIQNKKIIIIPSNKCMTGKFRGEHLMHWEWEDQGKLPKGDSN